MLPAGAKVCETQVILEITNLQDQETKYQDFWLLKFIKVSFTMC